MKAARPGLVYLGGKAGEKTNTDMCLLNFDDLYVMTWEICDDYDGLEWPMLAGAVGKRLKTLKARL